MQINEKSDGYIKKINLKFLVEKMNHIGVLCF